MSLLRAVTRRLFRKLQKLGGAPWGRTVARPGANFCAHRFDLFRSNERSLVTPGIADKAQDTGQFAIGESRANGRHRSIPGLVFDGDRTLQTIVWNAD